MRNTLEQETQALAEYYEQNPRAYHQDVYNDLIDNIDSAEQQGLLEVDEADERRLQALRDLNTRLLELDGYDVNEEDYEDDEEYSNTMNLTTFSSPYEFGAATLELIDDQYEDRETGILALSEVTGYEPEVIVDILSGEYLPDVDLIDEMSEAFELNEDEALGLQILGADARIQTNNLQGDAIEDYVIDEYYSDEEDLEDDEYDDEDEEDETYSRVQQLEGQIAEFQVREELKNEVDTLIRQGVQLLEEGKMYPVEFSTLFGNMPDALDNDKLATFSATCEQNDVDYETQLFAYKTALGMIARRGVISNFSRIVSDTIDESMQEENYAVDKQAKINLQMYRERGFFE